MRAILLYSLFCICSIPGYSQQKEIRTYYDTQKRLIKETYEVDRDSVLNGHFASYNQNGARQVKGFFKNNKADSLWVYYYENGRKKAEGLFKRGIQNGGWAYYYESGRRKSEGILEKSKKNGPWTNFYENGGEKSNGGYINDLKQGVWNYFFEDGTIKAQAYYQQGDGEYKEYYPSGKLRMAGYNKKEKSHGEWNYYYESGELQAVGQFSKGLRTGSWKHFYLNQKLLAEGRYTNGKKTGNWRYYYENGQLSSEGVLVNGEKSGQWNLFYEDGEVKSKASYEDGNGMIEEYHVNGALKTKGEIQGGQRTGPWTFFDEDGKIEGKVSYDKGVGQYLGYYPNGKLKMEGTLEDDKRSGKWTLYNPDGSIAGVYHPVYEEEQPVFRMDDLINTPTERTPVEKPEYKFKSSSIRYFSPIINEYQGFIAATNPIWMFAGRLPLSLEYYYQERLGYELQFILHRDPFFTNSEEVEFGKPFQRGGTIRFRQKFYHPDQRFGMLYFGHQISVARINHQANILNVNSAPFERTIKATETLGSYGLFVGWRWMREAGAPGLTLDAYAGVDIGFRDYEKLYVDNPEYDEVFQSINKSSLYLPIIVGLNIGLAGPKQKRSK
ncbi:MAG: hypothetical protein KI790_05660 [Cyclobacteriaceae bacterium]|nr:hypothetical protein [Cyclobacteriaceae bacterium HetDA_MAG_MS6]